MNDAERIDRDDEALSALIDGMLDEADAERLRRRIAEEPRLARRHAELRGIDEKVRGAWAEVLDEPLPERVTSLLREDAAVTPFRRRRPRAAGMLAAGIGLAAGFLLAWILLPGADPVLPPGLAPPGGAIAFDSGLHRTLQTDPSASSREVGGGWRATPRLTFLNRAGAPCRQVDLQGPADRLTALACRSEGAWRVATIGLGAGGAAGEFYQQASGAADAQLEAAIDALIDGEPLGRDEETAWIARGWE